MAVEGRWTPLECDTDADLSVFDLDVISGLRRDAAVSAEQTQTIAFRSGPHRVAFHCAGAIEAARGQRICPTDDVIEVVSIDGEEALLIRPERVPREGPR